MVYHKRVFAVFCLLLVFLLGACNRSMKFYSVDIDDIGEQNPQQQAMIRLSDVQVFAREALINDRLQEKVFLEEQLQESKNAQFLPQLSRDLSTISALSAQLGISFDPALRLKFRGEEQSFKRESALAELQHDIHTTQLQAELLRVQQQLAALRAGTGSGPDKPPGGSGSPPPSPPGTSITGADTSRMVGKLDELLATVKTMMTSLGTDAGSPLRKTTIAASDISPEDQYEDLSGHRARLRADLATINLDDIHDLDGNALHRLQFRATILPGAQKNMWGIARLKAKAPELPEEEMRKLFFTWLAHSTRRLNGVTILKPDPQCQGMTILEPDPQYQRFATTELFDIVDITMDETPARGKAETGPQKLRLAVMKNTDRIIQSIINLAVDSECKELSCLVKDANVSSLDVATEVIKAIPSIEAVVTALGDYGVLPDEIRKKMIGILHRFDAIAHKASALLSSEERREIILAQVRIIPKPFCDVLLTKTGPPWSLKVCQGFSTSATGQTYAYTATPIQRTQRLSTVSSAANAVQLAFALAASVPQSGLGINAGLGSLHSTVGKVDTIERLPLVVGFTDGGEEVKDSSTHQAHFGWVFGPQVRLNPKKNTLELRQTVTSHQVMADLSLVSWWPKVTLQLQTAWVGNWSNTAPLDYLDATLPNIAQTTLDVRLPLNQADLDALSDTLSQDIFKQGLRSARIQHIHPSCVQTSEEPVTFQVYGAHLWRAPEVYIAGRKIEACSQQQTATEGQAPAACQANGKIAVLPDMAGLAVTVNKVPKGETDMTVVTQLGTAKRKITGPSSSPTQSQSIQPATAPRKK